MTTKKLLSQTEFAKLKGWSKSYVNKIIKLGMIPYKDGLIDVAEADKSLKENSDPSRKLDKPVEQMNFTEARTVREQYRALKEMQDYQKRVGQLLDTDTVMRLQGAVLQNIRSRILSLPAKLAVLSFGSSTIAENEAIIRKGIHEVLDEISTINFRDVSRTGKK